MRSTTHIVGDIYKHVSFLLKLEPRRYMYRGLPRNLLGYLQHMSREHKRILIGSWHNVYCTGDISRVSPEVTADNASAGGLIICGTPISKVNLLYSKT